MVLSPSAGSSQRVTGLKCIAKVSVPSGAATAVDAEARSRTAQSSGAQWRTGRASSMR